MVSSDVLSRILGRSSSLFHTDMEEHRARILDAIAQSRILVTGAAGSIGHAFIEQLASFRPATLHLVDPSENNLVEVVRSLRSSDHNPPDDFRTWAIGMGTLEFERFLAAAEPYDTVVNFAALKHVRSERDPFTLMRLIHTNIFSLQEMLEILLKRSAPPPKRVFSVSSDKAVNPENAMGASKAFMEKVLWHHAPSIQSCTSARFANVAFSDGSLLHGFLKRLERRQPLSAPQDVRRYFISHQEAGQLCLLACFLGHNRELFVPRMDPTEDLKTFSDIAQLFLKSRGYQPKILPSEAEARGFAHRMDNTTQTWPCYFSQSDTSGEKPFEEFSSEDEHVDFSRYHRLGVISNPPFNRSDTLQEVLATLQEIRQASSWHSRDMVTALQKMIPSLHHEEKNKNLDQKM